MIPSRISRLLFLLSILFYWFPPSIQFLARRRFLKQARFVLDVLHQLSTTPLQIYNVSNSMECTYKCIEHDQCLSFNMAVNSIGGLKLCQLLPTDKYNASSSFTPSADFNYHHIHIGVETAAVNPCNGGLVRPFYWTGNFQCQCPGLSVPVRNCEGDKINTVPVGVEAKDNKYGTFHAIHSGQILKFKLVHIAGGLTCWHGQPGYEMTKFGCGPHIAMYITNQANSIVSPVGPQYASSWSYSLLGVTTNDSEITLPEIDPPLQVTAGQEFRLWYGEDLSPTIYEKDNFGKLEVDVYAFYALV